MNHAKLQKFLPFAHRNRIPVILWGPTGIGKTTGIYEYGASIGAKVIVLHLASQEPGDLVGLPVRERCPVTSEQQDRINLEIKKAKATLGDAFTRDDREAIIDSIVDHQTVWSRPEWMPKEDDPGKYIFFLDEFNRAPKYVLACMFPFLLEGRLHTHKIPKDSWVCAAANPDDDDYDVTEIHDRALVSRMCHIDLIPTSDEWLIRHADVVHEVISKVISKEPTHLGFSSFKLPFEIRPDARAVTVMGQALRNMTSQEFHEFGYEFCRGCVGETMAAMIQKEWKDCLENISPEDVLNNYKKIRSEVKKFASVDNIRNDVIGGANKKLLVHIKKLGKLSDEQMANLMKYTKDIPRDSASGFLIQMAAGEEYREDAVFVKIMEIFGDDDDLYQYVLEAHHPDAAKKLKEKEDEAKKKSK